MEAEVHRRGDYFEASELPEEVRRIHSTEQQFLRGLRESIPGGKEPGALFAVIGVAAAIRGL